jgi:MFS family permease
MPYWIIMACIPIRYLIILTLSLVGFVAYLNRSNVNLAIVSMVIRPNETAENPNLCPALDPEPEKRHGNSNILHPPPIHPTDVLSPWSSNFMGNGPDDKYDWSPELQGIVLSAFFYTYFAFQIPAGYLVTIFGSHKPILGAALASSLISIASTFVADLSVYAFIALRCLLGACQAIFFPAMFVITCSWVPERERSTAIAVSYAGISVSTITLSFASGFLVNAYTWKSMFFLPGILSLIISVVILLFLRNRPEDHCLVSAAELETIRDRDEKKDEESQPLVDSNENFLPITALEAQTVVKDPIPWIGILTNKAALSILLFRFTRGILIYLVGSEIPTYFVTVLHLDLVTLGYITASNSVLSMIFGISMCKVSEMIIERGLLTRTNTRKAFSIICGLIDTTVIMMIPTLRCNRNWVLAAYVSTGVLGSTVGAAEGPILAEISVR